jgi:rhodanese-related sulfurtransferase
MIRGFNFFSLLMLPALMMAPLFGEAVLKASPPLLDFGTIREGIIVPVTFTLTNEGTSDADLKEVRTFGACVQSHPLGAESLKPGESINLDYKFLSVGYGGISIDNQIEVHYNNSALSPLKMKVRGTVLALETYHTHFGDLTYNYDVLIDIRSALEYGTGHILGALSVPSSRLKEWVLKNGDRLPPEVVIYLISEDGSRSDEAAQLLQSLGFTQFRSLVGGMREWIRQFGLRLIISEKKQNPVP